MLTKFTKKADPFVWVDKQEEAFQSLKNILCGALILSLPEGNDDLVVYRDMYISRLCYVLMQHWNVIAYASRQLKSIELNYLVHDLKLAIVVFELMVS